MVRTELPHPPDKGGRIRTFEMIRRLARRHEVSYLCLDDGTIEPAHVAEAARYARAIVRVPAPRREHPLVFAANALRSTLGELPYGVLAYRSREQRRACAEWLAREGADLVICDFLAPSVNLPERIPCPVVLFQHNVESEIWRRRYEQARSPAGRALLHAQWRKMARYEGVVTRQVDQVITVSARDTEMHRGWYGVERVEEVPTGVDVDRFRPPLARRRPSELLFLGSLDWDANEDGVVWFLEEVLPRVRARCPEALFRVVGRRPTMSLRLRLRAQPGVELHASVPDVLPYLQRCGVFVVPLRLGGGTRLKIFEAMATGAPVVATSLGAEGLPLERGRDLAIADAPGEMADTICELVRDPARAALLGDQGARTVRERFGWDAAVARFEEICLRVAGRA